MSTPGQAAYRLIMEREGLVARLATAVRHRDHWRLDGQAAVYERPGAVSVVRVVALQPRTGPRRNDMYQCTILKGGVARFARVAGTPSEAITWAEQVPLD